MVKSGQALKPDATAKEEQRLLQSTTVKPRHARQRAAQFVLGSKSIHADGASGNAFGRREMCTLYTQRLKARLIQFVTENPGRVPEDFWRFVHRTEPDIPERKVRKFFSNHYATYRDMYSQEMQRNLNVKEEDDDELDDQDASPAEAQEEERKVLVSKTSQPAVQKSSRLTRPSASSWAEAMTSEPPPEEAAALLLTLGRNYSSVPMRQ
jgi:hypothetical protein